jgi:hypothetical protein
VFKGRDISVNLEVSPEGESPKSGGRESGGNESEGNISYGHPYRGFLLYSLCFMLYSLK